MSLILENRAILTDNRRYRPIHFRDYSWTKNRECKFYNGFSRGDGGEMTKYFLMVPIGEPLTEEDCSREIRDIKKVHDLAELFNSVVSTNFKIKILLPQKAIIDRTAGVHHLKARRRCLSRSEWVLVFEKVGRTFQVFVDRKGERRCCDVLNAFVHFTYIASQGKYVVSSLHGVREHSNYFLYCPLLSNTDNDIAKVMRNHTCNHICREFQFPEDRMPLLPALIPTAPPLEDSESDDDGILSQAGSNHDLTYGFELQRDITHQYYAVPVDVTPGPYPRNDQRNIPFGQDIRQPPPYCRHCPDGHRVVDCCGHYDVSANLNYNLNQRRGNVAERCSFGC